jgi:hypothetical protein
VNCYSVIDHSKVPAEPPLGVINFLTQLYRRPLSLVFVSVNCRRLDYALRLHRTISTFRALSRHYRLHYRSGWIRAGDIEIWKCRSLELERNLKRTIRAGDLLPMAAIDSRE